MSGRSIIQRGPASLRPFSGSPAPFPTALGPSGQPPYHATGVVLVQGREAYEGVHVELRSALYAGECNFCRRNANYALNGEPSVKVVELSGDGPAEPRMATLRKGGGS